MVWEANRDEAGREYYYNTESGESQWEKPRELWTPQDHKLFEAGWTEYTSDDGKKYWHNSKTDESVWEYPLSAKRKGDEINANATKLPKLAETPKQVSPKPQTFFDVVAQDFEKYGDTEFGHVFPRIARFSEVQAIGSARERRNQFNKAIDQLTGKASRLNPEEIASIYASTLHLVTEGDFGWPFSTDWTRLAEASPYKSSDLAMVSDQLAETAQKLWNDHFKETEVKMESRARQEFVALLKKLVSEKKLDPGSQWSTKAVRDLVDGAELRALCGNERGSGPGALLDEVVGKTASAQRAILEY